MLRYILAGLGALAVSAPALAQACDDRDPGLLARFEGEWQSDGNAFGQPAQSTMRWTPVLDGCFWQMEYLIEYNPGTDEAGTFHGVGVHHHESDLVTGHWVDNWGAMHQLRGSTTESEMIVFWGEPTAQLGRSRYTLTEDGAIQVTDWILTNDAWQQFNDNRFERVAD
ncbi:hypothetical protein V0U79_13420 [Hyphobacterium sp. HN65]|uniref:DUF1579 domain-containing protein n=1 Tax=Hyphobacterium lacteum TaxID=3116575 RepID=A0ABU7LTX6_9PROT|nr:hypothetical protein [Hyphobacterium sp. HN65]MEE2527361.1 hypothetical protein [Hyphobacterium sp. HN65]